MYNVVDHSSEISEKQNVSVDLFFVSLRPTAEIKEIEATTSSDSKAYVTISKASVTLHNSPKSIANITANFVIVAVTLGILVWLIVLIWKITSSLSRGKVLTNDNIRRIRIVAFLLMAKAAVTITSQYIDLYYLKSIVSLKGYEMFVDISYTKIIVGLMMLVFAEVLVVANRIREEQELTI
jgi:Protein of unknown function (DUF2975).